MSLEQAIADNTAAIRDLIAYLGSKPTVLVRAADPEAPKANLTPEDQGAAAVLADQAPPPVTRDSAKDIAKQLNVKDAKKLKEVLTTLGAPNFAAVKDEQLAEFVKLAKAVL